MTTRTARRPRMSLRPRQTTGVTDDVDHIATDRAAGPAPTTPPPTTPPPTGASEQLTPALATPEADGLVVEAVRDVDDPGRSGLNPAQQQVLSELGSTDRPVFRDDLGPDLRHYLEDELAELVARSDRELFLSKHQLGLLHGCEARYAAEQELPFAWSIASARGSVAHKAIELMVTHRGAPTPLDLVERAVERIEDDEQSLGDFIRRLDEGQRAELAGRANDFVTTFMETFPPLERQWKPVPEYSLRALLCDDRLTLRGKADLSLGYVRHGREAGKVLVDLKTGQPNHAHLEDLRFYALLEVLKLGVPPRLLVNYYLDAGTPRGEAVTEDLLWAAARRVVDGVVRMAALVGPDPRAPIRTPGLNCRWCPLNDDCDEGRRHLEGSEEDDWRPPQ